MIIQGIEVTAELSSGPITEEEAERIYVSLEANFAIKSIDMAIDFEANTLGFLFGVENPGLTGNDEFVKEIVNDALMKAFGEQEEGGVPLSPTFSEGLIGAF